MEKDWVNDYIRKHRATQQMLVSDTKAGRFEYMPELPRVLCVDGFAVSMQVSRGHYCRPREDNAIRYTAVELGYPSIGDPLIKPYAEDLLKDEPVPTAEFMNPEYMKVLYKDAIRRSETDTVYGYVPIEIVNALFEKHGGISD